MTIFLIVCGIVLLRAAIRALARAIPSRAVRCCIWTAIGVVPLVIAVVLVKNNPAFNNTGPGANSPANIARCNDAVELALIGLVFVLWPWIDWFLDSVIGSVRAATAPIPSPAEIHQTLSNYYGRPATIEEVAAAQSIYVHQRNEAAAQAALGIGALFMLNDAARRAKGQ